MIRVRRVGRILKRAVGSRAAQPVINDRSAPRPVTGVVILQRSDYGGAFADWGRKRVDSQTTVRFRTDKN
jgi:hypothetical protein